MSVCWFESQRFRLVMEWDGNRCLGKDGRTENIIPHRVRFPCRSPEDIVNKSESKAKAEADLVDYICKHGNLRGHNIIFKRLFDLGM